MLYPISFRFNLVLCQKWSYLTLRKIPWNFSAVIFIRIVSRMGGQEGGYLEDVEGFWPETWRTGSSLMSWRILFYPKEDTLKVSCWYLYHKCVRNGGVRRGLLGGCWGFLTGDMEYRVIRDVMNALSRPRGSYPESFVSLSWIFVEL